MSKLIDYGAVLGTYAKLLTALGGAVVIVFQYFIPATSHWLPAAIAALLVGIVPNSPQSGPPAGGSTDVPLGTSGQPQALQ